MSRESDARAYLDALSRLNRQQWLLRSLVLVLPALGFAVEVAAGAAVQTLPIVLLVGFTVVSVLLPDSHAPMGVLLVLGVYWAMSVDESLSVWLLLAAVVVVAFHVTCQLASYGPPSVVLDGVLVRLWLLRSALLVAVAVLVWVAARVATGLDPAGHGWLLGAALLLVVGWAGVLSRRLATAAG